MPVPNQTAADFPRTDVTLSEDLIEAWNRAAWIGEQSTESTLRSFTSMLALLHAAPQRWWLRYCEAVGVDLRAIYASLRFRPASLGVFRKRIKANEVPKGKEPTSASLLFLDR
ncbi:hypothetical protein WKW77_26330 [Variovorax ureilyticus]|uniref:Uncharacterized protein n=1 Tax=Variovorax ureilyticus TaxID=1836198 RepID=A0ABU8VLV8_9BURK